MKKLIYETTPIFVSDTWKDEFNLLFEQNFSSYHILCDENTFAACLPLILDKNPLLKEAQIIQIPAGEEYKNLKTAKFIWNALQKGYAKRNSLLINVGGGVISDLGGFCASTYMRGIPFVNIPTSLLAMVDASLGGKTGIDFKGLKNFIGTFAHPQNVLICLEFLRTLPERQVVSGFAEMVKHGLIADSKHLEAICAKGPFKIGVQEIIDSIKIKKNIVERDLNEQAERKLLNFGHTIGHALESFCLNKKKSILHGEAVFTGMLLEAFISYQKGLLNKKEYSYIQNLLLPYIKTINFSEKDFPKIVKYISLDKKGNAAQSNFTLIKKRGKGIINQSVSEEEIISALAFYHSIN